MEEMRQCFRRINRWAQSYVARHTHATGLSPAQIEALRHITYHQTMSQQQLVEHMGVDKAAVTRLISGLEEQGYVVRAADPADGRAKLIQPTPAAVAVKEDVLALEGDYYRWLLEALPPEQRPVFEVQLRLLLARAREGRKNGYAQLEGREEGEAPCI